MPLTIATSKIAQQTMRFLEQNRPSSLADDAPVVLAAGEQYDIALNMIMEHEDWSFASKISEIGPIVDGSSTYGTDPDLPFLFALPSDALVLRDVLDLGVKYRLDFGVLRCDHEGPIAVRYTAKIINENQLPATVHTAVALQLAILLAPDFLTVMRKRERLESQLTDALIAARRFNARTASPNSYIGNSNDWVAEAKL